MINYSSINCPNDRTEDNRKYEIFLNEVFKYTSNVNVHVLYNFIAPTNQLGEYDHILFIDIPYAKGNYYRTPNKVYLHSLAIAVRTFEEPEVIDVDESCFYTEVGSWEYVAEMESDRQALRSFVYDNIPNVKHFDIAMIYIVNAPNSHKEFQNEKVYFNTEVNLWQVINNAIELTKNKDGAASNCIVYKDKETANDWSYFLTSFIDISEDFTKQGILTKRKIDNITKKKTSRLMEKANQATGRKLCIISGKTGTGKTLSLLRLMYEQVRKGEDAPKHNCRLLTFNNMLVMDLKMVMKGIGEFTPTKASISTLHKFFYDIYKVSPVRYLHMDVEKINSLFNLCLTRTLSFNSILLSMSAQKNQNDLVVLINELNFELTKKDSRIKDKERSEWKEYHKYLLKKKEPQLSELMDYAQEYVDYKRKIFLENYHRQAFLSGYNVILEELYLIFHNLEDFMNKYNMKIAYSMDELRNSEDFKTQYQELYNQFLKKAGEKLIDEYGEFDDIIPGFIKNLEDLDRTISEHINKTNEEPKELLQDSLKKIKRKVNWSRLILVDEAQDCQINEKALLLELNGSDNTVIATGGKDQLIRTAKENDWSQLFGRVLDVEEIPLKSVSFRQKGNIILFLNEFASIFNIETNLSVPDETKDFGRVIIDCRSFPEAGMIPLDIVDSLHLNGKDMGCSNFENMMFLLPKTGFVKREKVDETDVTIDGNNTIIISQASAKRSLNMGLPDNYKPIDGTVNDKREALKNVGHDNTRCLLYESCRGLEAWNVMCMDIDVFYFDKISSKDAVEYAESNIGGLFEEGKNKYMTQYAVLWCFMAMTRAIDTLYIKLSNTNNDFSRAVINIAQKFSFVEIKMGSYSPTK